MHAAEGDQLNVKSPGAMELQRAAADKSDRADWLVD